MEKSVQKKVVIIIIVAYILISLLLVLFSGYSTPKFVVFNDDVYEYKDSNFIKQEDYIKKTPIELYVENNYEGKFSFIYDDEDEEVTFYQGKKVYNKTGANYFAVTKNINVDIINYEKEQMDNDDMLILNQVLTNLSVTNYEMLGTSEKIKFDYDNDNEEETIYFVSNLFLESENDKVFNLVYTIDDGKIKYLEKQVNAMNQFYDSCTSSLFAITDFEKDGNYEYIIECSYFDKIGSEYNIYNYENNKFKLINK